MPAVDEATKQRFLDTYEREHQTTMKVLRAYPADKLELRPHRLCKTARELAWVFVLERRLGAMLFDDAFASAPPRGTPPPAPQDWHELLAALEGAHREFGDRVRRTSLEELGAPVRFFVGPKTPGDIPRIDIAWLLLLDQIHHRGQFSIYLRMADGKVPSIYGPSADEPWT
ncbi:MAG TPA: DinB family protein [Vicinamibacterales bacterium]|nr:DinB family protein [Vicinamibacterales bacterium]